MKVLFWSRAGKRQALPLCALGTLLGSANPSSTRPNWQNVPMSTERHVRLE